MNNQELIDLTEVIKVFEENYVFKMRLQSERIFDKRGGHMTQEEQLKYNETLQKTEFLEMMTKCIKNLINYTAITNDCINTSLQKIQEYGVMKSGELRPNLMTEQRQILTDMIQKLEKISNCYSEDYKLK